MKKLLIVLLILAMVLGMSGVAFAVDGPVDQGSITFTKYVTGGGNPEETFEFTIGNAVLVDGSASTYPNFASQDFSIKVEEGESSGTTTLTLPTFNKPGTYKYEIKETGSNTAGMTYDDSTKFLLIKVINDGDGGFIRIPGIFMNADEDGNPTDKSSTFAFNNEFKSGSLKVNKVLEGNYTDPNDEFTVTVTLTAVEGKTLNPSAIVTNGAVSAGWDNENYVIVYKVNGGDKKDFTIQNIPYNVDYTVVETGFDGYDPKYIVSYDNANGEMNAELIETTITNTRGIDVEVGVTLDNLPYVLTLVMALGGLALFVFRKRIFN